MQLKRADHIDQFIELFTKGIEAWIEAGKIVVAAVENDPDFAEKVHDQHPEISIDTVYAFERIGRRELHPKLVVSDSPGAKKLRRLPYVTQQKYVDNPVPLLIRNNNKWETLQVNLFNLTTEQAAQVFDGDGIRSDSAQRAWLEDKHCKAVVQVDEPYRVTGKKLIVLSPCQFTAKQLAGFLVDME